MPAGEDLNFSCLMTKNGQSYFKNLVVLKTQDARFSKYIWPFFNILYGYLTENLPKVGHSKKTFFLLK